MIALVAPRLHRNGKWIPILPEPESQWANHLNVDVRGDKKESRILPRQSGFEIAFQCPTGVSKINRDGIAVGNPHSCQNTNVTDPRCSFKDCLTLLLEINI